MSIKDKISRWLFNKLVGDLKVREENVRVKGYARLVLRGPDGNIKAIRESPNVIVDDGEEMLADLIGGNETDYVENVAVGEGTTTATDTDVVLESQLEDRHTLDSHARTGSYVEFVSTFAAGHATGAITESGCFDSTDATVDTMLCRQTFAVINKGASDSLEVTWKITFA